MTNTIPKLVAPPEISDIVLKDDVFLVTIKGDANVGGSLGAIGATHAFPLEDLRRGASLSRIMTLSMRTFLKQEKCGALTPDQKRQFRDLSIEAVTTLRAMVERHLNREVMERVGLIPAA